MERLRQDFWHALRVIRSAPGFTALAVLTLTLGIGGTTAMFSVVNGVLLKPLTYKDPGDLVAVSSLMHATQAFPLSAYYFSQWRTQSQTTESIAAVGFGYTTSLTGTDEPERIRALRASANLFPLLGVQPQLGRSFLPAEDQQTSAARVAILSHGLWTRRFGGDPNVIGSKIQLNADVYEVIGVMPADFRFPKNDELHRMIRMPDQVDLWTPLVFSPQEKQEYVTANYAGIARLKSGISVSTAEAELNQIISRSPMPRSMSGLQIRLNPLRTEMVGRVQQGLVVLMVAVGIVLLISCANFTNLLIARATNHRHEIAVRAALGASRLQLASIAINESFLVSFLGAAGGAFLASWLIDLIRMTTARLPRVDEIGLDVPSLIFTVTVTFIAALIAGAAPAWRLSKVAPADALHDAGRTATAGRNARRFGAGLVSIESALCVVLTVIAALLIHSFMRITGLDQGFRAENAIAADIQLFGTRYTQPAARDAFFSNVISGLRALPGALAAGAVSSLPLTGQTNIMGINPETSPDYYSGGAQAEYRIATHGYFEAMNIPLIRGDIFEDRQDGPKTAVISEQTAKKFWPGQDPIGKRFMRRNRDEVFTVVGIVGNVRSTGPESEPPLMVYTPLAQQPLGGLTLVLRTTESAPAIRQTVASIDKTIPVSRIRNVEEVLSDAFATRRFQVSLLTSFAGVALLLSAIGLYGVVSASVAQRKKEIGIRLALGADKRTIASLVLREGLKPVLLGMAGGLVVAAAAARAIQSLLFSVAPFDFASYIVGFGVLLASAAAACWIPMRAATRVDPMTSIRYE